MKHHLSTRPPTVMYCTWNSSREQDVMLSFLSLNQNSISAFLDISCLWTSFSISLQIGLLQSQSQGWQNHSVTTRTGCSSLSAKWVKSQLVLNLAQPFIISQLHLTQHIWPPLGVVGIFIQKMWWHAYLKHLPKQRTEAKPRLRVPLGNGKRSWQCGPEGPSKNHGERSTW